ncbi:uncharacterized protein KQ657_002001 [Scheffersomyces spartinae]|uniref:Glutamine amidotransferase domain-containing protein n=1 Tax=Scheffersomyces spartinae TaxID=45513 RepID=A0A9P8AHA1_9ASCO|nr:uncharacterized protein KQ657_002001 [Scheffersomyces spartinae]KAG7192282.1 hypothetical protein KQ657_002001 [Scheffersomyces spartinae]
MTVEGKPHIAVLVCDTPIPGIAEVHGDFGDNVKQLVTQANKDTSIIDLPLKKYQVSFEEKGVDHSEQLDGVYQELTTGISDGTVKGVILTGSRSDSFATDVQWITRLDVFLQRLLFEMTHVPVVGLCFGHQIIAKNLGASVGRNKESIGWECGTTTISLSNDLFRLPNSPFDQAGSGTELKLNLVEFHRDIVQSMPPPRENLTFINIGHTAKCAIQGLITCTGATKVLTFQGHPEFTTVEALDMLQRDIDLNIIDNATFQKAKYNTEMLTNLGTYIGKVISYFFRNNID